VWGPAPVNDASALISAFVVLTLAAAASVFFALRADTDLVVIVPLLSMLAVGLSRIAIGPEVTSALLLPVMWLALRRGTLWLVVSVLATAGVLLLPYAWPTTGELV